MNEKDEFCQKAADLLGDRGWTRDGDMVTPWLTDWRGRFTGRALGMASPVTALEVSRLVKLCGEYGVPIVPQGGNSGMSGGATPDESGDAVLLSLRRMTQVRRFDEKAREITCEAGMILQTLHDQVEAEGLRFPLTLGGKGSATIGGLIATNAGGTQVLRHGSMGAQVLGLEVVLADGQVFDALTPLKKDNRGFDLKQMMIGSEGTLGIVTAATLRLLPALADRAVLWAGLGSVHDTRSLLHHVQDMAGNALEGFEILPRHSFDAVIAHSETARSPLAGTHEWHALIELAADAASADALPKLAENVLMSAFEKGLVEDAAIAQNETQAAQFWGIREDVPIAERALGPAVQHDISVPVARMPEFIAEAVPKLERDFPGTKAVAFGHLGDGNVHFHVIADSDADPATWYNEVGSIVSRQVYNMVTRYQGSISAEHGIGQLKLAELARLADPVKIALMQQVKTALDPSGILNPGKLVPLASEAVND